MNRSARLWQEWQRGTLGFAFLMGWTLVVAPDAVPDQRGHHGDTDRDRGSGPERLLDGADRRGEQVPAERDDDHPGDAAGDVPDSEPPYRHPRGAGHPGSEDANERDEHGRAQRLA